MPSTKQLWILAGGNGAGKSTFYSKFLAHRGLPFLNADNLAKKQFAEDPEAHSYEAAQIIEQLRHSMLIAGRSFCFETVFSHPSKIDFVARAKALGYQIILVFIHLETTELNLARISQRMAEGGQNVPDDKVIQRIPRTLTHIKNTLPLCDQVYILDNSSRQDPFRLILRFHNHQPIHWITPIPDWARTLLPYDLKQQISPESK